MPARLIASIVSSPDGSDQPFRRIAADKYLNAGTPFQALTGRISRFDAGSAAAFALISILFQALAGRISRSDGDYVKVRFRSPDGFKPWRVGSAVLTLFLVPLQIKLFCFKPWRVGSAVLTAPSLV